MQKQLLFKALAIFILALLLLIPLSMISAAISERAQRRDAVTADIAQTVTGEQTVAGPVLVLPYTLSRATTRLINGATVHSTETVESSLYFLPSQLSLSGDVDTQTRRRGLFEALLYDTELQIGGHFKVPAQGGLSLKANETVAWGKAYVAVGIQDNRGIQNVPELRWGALRYAFQPGNPVAALGSGIHAPLSPAVADGGRFAFDMKLSLQGTTRLGWLPLGEDTRVSLRSSWPHPSFVGSSVPRRHAIDDKGFKAEWETSHFASNMPQLFEQALKADGERRLLDHHVSVRFVQPVDIYQQAERSVKYGFLFVMLTFAAFALFEILKGLPIHPVQYGLVGIALALFFLLLIALSEHLDFGLSYAAASVACVGLLTFYLSHVLRSIWRGLGFGVLLILLYGALYGLLISEDSALLMGSLLLFVLLAGVMLLTRHVDWYALGNAQRAEPAARTVGERASEL